MNGKWKPLTYAGQPLTPQPKGRYLKMFFFTYKAFRQARKQLLEKAKAKVWASSDHDKVIYDVHKGIAESFLSMHPGYRIICSRNMGDKTDTQAVENDATAAK